jgi:hypothetical protein
VSSKLKHLIYHVGIPMKLERNACDVKVRFSDGM